jgi:hypothetical protein
MLSFADEMRSEARRAFPYALVLLLALGTVVSVGAHYSNAFPSQDRPFGWPGPARFENAVAMVRGDLVLAASVPALLLGAVAFARRDPRVDGVRRMGAAFAAHALLLVAACFCAGAVGGLVAFKAPTNAFLAFSVAHALLALSFYALAFLCGALAGRHALPAAAAVWLGFNAVYESVVRTVVFRQVGGDALAQGQFPGWFYVAQALSPLSAYRGTLILWERGFMDYLEKAALGKAALPAWMNPGVFAALTLVLWVALPVGLGLLAWRWKGRSARRASLTRPVPDGPA